MDRQEIFETLGIKDLNDGAFNGRWLKTRGKRLESRSPIDGSLLGVVAQAGEDDYEMVISEAREAFKTWCTVPAPRRGEVMHHLGMEMRRYKDPLGTLVSMEMGKLDSCTFEPNPKNRRIYDHAISDHAGLILIKYTGWNNMKNIK